MSALVTIPDFDHRDDEALSAGEWCQLLGGITQRAFRLRGIPDSGGALIKSGQLARVYKFCNLPEDYRERLISARERHGVSLFRDLLDVHRVEQRGWEPKRASIADYTPAAQAKAHRKQEVMRVYYAAYERDGIKKSAEIEAIKEHIAQFGRSISNKQIRRWVKAIDTAGGFEFAPLHAYCDEKDVPHVGARLATKLPPELVAEFKLLTTKCEHLSGAHRALEIAWLAGREVPGLGSRRGDEPFPYTLKQLRQCAASTPARRKGSHGNARARRETLPYIVGTTANLRRAELYVLDDTRIDIIALDDLTGRPVELKSYWMLDVATRRIEGYLIREAGNIKSTDVDALIARVLRSSGFGSNYLTTIKHERGTVACSPARQTFLESAFPGRLRISRTGMDGGKNHGGDFTQAASGHWMGKPWIESAMRTVAFFLEHLPGQRGGNFRRQPAALGLKGRDSDGMLAYTRDSRIHDAALLAYADRAIEYIEDGLEGRKEAYNARNVERLGGRMKIRSLLSVSHVSEAIREMVAYYNQRTAHRMEGFQRVEFQDEKSGALKWRMESPNEKAARLERLNPTERLSVADCSVLVRHVAKTVTVRPNGVTFDLAPYKGLRFWREDSIACTEAMRLTGCEKKYVAVFDPEAILHGGYAREIYLLSGTGPNWKPGDPAKFLEALPLADWIDRANPERDAAALEQSKRVERRYSREVLHAAGPEIARTLAETADNTGRLREVVTTMRAAASNVVETDFRPPRAELTRVEQQREAAPDYAASIADAIRKQETEE